MSFLLTIFLAVSIGDRDMAPTDAELLDCYAKRYPDLKTLSGLEMLRRHWQDYGANENRSASCGVADLDHHREWLQLVVTCWDTRSVSPKGAVRVVALQRAATGEWTVTRRVDIAACDGKCMLPKWSPDGSRVIYADQAQYKRPNTRFIRKFYRIRLARLDKRGPKAAREMEFDLEWADSHGPGMIMPGWFPDGRHVYFMMKNRTYVLDTQGQHPIRDFFPEEAHVPTNQYLPHLSPDGSKFFFSSLSKKVSVYNGSVQRLWVANSDGSALKPLGPNEGNVRLDGPGVKHPIEAPLAQKVPAVSPDGNLVAYWEGVGREYCYNPDGGLATSDSQRMWQEQNRSQDPVRDDLLQKTWKVFVHDLRTGKRTRVAPGVYYLDNPGWTPDGQLLVSNGLRGVWQPVSKDFKKLEPALPKLCHQVEVESTTVPSVRP